MHFTRSVLGVASAALLAVALTAGAPATASADEHHHRRNRDRDDGRRTRVVYVQQQGCYAPPVYHAPVYYEPRSRGGPYYDVRARYGYARPRSSFALSFSIGNFAPAGYDYYDPYCDREFRSLRSYRQHLRSYQHRSEIRVVREYDVSDNYPVASYRLRGDDWERCGD